MGQILNAVACKNASDGWGLSRKTSGNRCPSPSGDIACDILFHRPSDTLFDVFRDAENGATATWQNIGKNPHNDRPWIAPVCIPVDPGTPTDPDPKEPPYDLKQTLEEIKLLLLAIEHGQKEQTNDLNKAIIELRQQVEKGVKIRW